MDHHNDGQRFEEARNEALMNIVVLESIIGNLPVADMRSCRLVNSIWLDAATAQLRKKDTAPLISNVKRVHSFLEFWGSQDERMESERRRPPFTKIALKLDRMKLDESQLDRLFQTMAPFITEMNLTVSLNNCHYQFSNDDVYEKLSYPNLSEYCIRLVGNIANAEKGDDGGRYRGLVCGILKNTPNLRQLQCYVDCDEDTSEKYFHWLIDTLRERKCGNKKLKIFGTYSGGMMDPHFARMADELALNLDALHISAGTAFDDLFYGPDEDGLFRFLQGQGESLKSLYLRGVTGLFEYLGVPKMKKLESLIVEKWKPLPRPVGRTLAPSVNYQENLPVLKKIKFTDFDIDNDDWIQFLPRFGSPPIASLEELKLPTKVNNVDHIEHCIRSFPNLKILRIPATVPFLNLVYRYLPEIEELILDTYHTNNIDDVITGFSLAEREFIDRFTDKMLKRIKEDNPDENDLSPRPLSVLKHLKILRLRPRFRPNKIELTKVSSRLVLMKMKSLQILDLSHRSERALTGFEDVIKGMQMAGKVIEYRKCDYDDNAASIFDVFNYDGVEVEWRDHLEDAMLNGNNFRPPRHY